MPVMIMEKNDRAIEQMTRDSGLDIPVDAEHWMNFFQYSLV